MVCNSYRNQTKQNISSARTHHGELLVSLLDLSPHRGEQEVRVSGC